ncbi:uncharacterized protein LOC135481323 [Liolophura sinensis]|uniref:uncharacterized protein LOC135481323 n=1 Tax=Liolophura sinensis TaxID=3198878 RepID=UPI0031592096
MADIEVRMLCADDEDRVRQFVCIEFIDKEPLSKSLNMTGSEDGVLWFDVAFPVCLKDRLSVLAIDSSTGEIVGLRFAAIVYKDKPDAYNFSKDDPKMRKLALNYEITDKLYEGLNLFAKYNVDTLVNFRGICVAEKYQRQGIGTKMVAKTLQLIQERNFRLVTAESSGRFSSRIFEKFGFEKLVQHDYNSLFLDGEPLNMTDELRFHQGISLHVKIM